MNLVIFVQNPAEIGKKVLYFEREGGRLIGSRNNQ